MHCPAVKPGLVSRFLADVHSILPPAHVLPVYSTRPPDDGTHKSVSVLVTTLVMVAGQPVAVLGGMGRGRGGGASMARMADG